MKNRVLKIATLVFLITAILGCSNTNNRTVKQPNQVNSPPVAENTTNVATRTDKIKIKTETGTDLFELKQQEDGAKLVDGKEQEIARIKSEKSGKVKFKNPADKTLGYVVTEKGSWKLESSQNQGLYSLKKQNNGDYSLEDAGKKLVYRIKSNDKGIEILNPNKQLVYQVRIKEGKTALRNPAGKTVFYTKSSISPIAFTCFGFDVLNREQQAALAYAVNLTGGQ
ncbi:hypothetical protein ACX27_03530 [Nostoc piscinale CENA21]|uniref:Lipoprotein n=1 Tax=Nostoc piscinale CENA21 TaxID=224013 RepID=A0A0M5MGP6_9NOSO|nr:hypothetical protein [Nostoc piscinale]ALF52130.1 hypothetical protein ACX27_03530 [Nostoc piscinale CENA21]